MIKNDMENRVEAELRVLVTKWTSHMKWRANYEEWVNGRLWQEKQQEFAIIGAKEALGDFSRRKVLDLGCGMGGFSMALNQKGVDIVPIDFNPDTTAK